MATKRNTNTYTNEWGITSNDKDECVGVNINALLRKYRKIFPTARTKSGIYYEYDKQGFWKRIEKVDIKRRLRSILHKFKPDIWDAEIDREVETILPLACFPFEKLKDASNYINLKNGLLDLRTFELLPHSKLIASLAQLPFNYNPKAKCPVFKETFLKQTFMEDEQLIMRVQEMMGYCLSPDTKAQAFFILYSEGSSGKSVLCSIMRELAGGADNVSSVTLANLDKNFQRSQLYGKVLNISTENEANKISTEALKAISSGDPIQIEEKYKAPFTARVTTKMLFAMNTLPASKDTTYAFYRRIILIPFPAKFVDNPEKENEFKRDLNIETELMNELPGILTWSIKGLKRLMRNNYQFTRSVLSDKLMTEYCRYNAPVFDFVVECVRKASSDNRIDTDMLYSAYRQWHLKSGFNNPLPKNSYLKELRNSLNQRKIPYEEPHSGNKRYFSGISLANNYQAERVSSDYE